MKNGLSAVIITLNEERNLKRCLSSLSGLVDEIVVVDSGSTDLTIKIAKEMDCKVLEVEWKGYSQTKNMGNEMATYEYVFSIDADECVSDELKISILKEKGKGFSGTYSFNRLTNYCGSWIKNSGWYPDVKLRIFPKSVTKWEGEIHEKLVFDKELKPHHLDGDLLHYSYYNYSEHRQRADKYSLLTAKKMHDNGKSAGPLKPFLSAFARFMGMYFLKAGFMDGKAGLMIAWISAQSNHFKYEELRRLNSQK